MASRGEGRRTLAPEVLDEIVRRVVEVANPEKIILFGSAARGEMGPKSDVDLLIVVRGPTHTGRLSTAVSSGLTSSGIKEPVDAVVVTSESVERYRNSHALVIKPALREGRVLYEGPPGSRPPAEFDLPPDYVENQMASDRFPPDDPREWLNRARSNLAMARALVPDAYLEDLCYQAQQAAEKAIKAVMIQRDIEFPYTHDIERLLKFLSQKGEVPQTVWAAQDLTRFAFADRYPGNEPPLSEEDYRRNLAVAEVVVRWAEELIGT